MGFVRIFWKNNVQQAYLPKMSILGQIVSETLAGYTQHNWATISETICPEMFIFGRYIVGLLEIVLSEYPDKSHNFRNFIFMTSHFSTLYLVFCM